MAVAAGLAVAAHRQELEPAGQGPHRKSAECGARLLVQGGIQETCRINDGLESHEANSAQHPETQKHHPDHAGDEEPAEMNVHPQSAAHLAAAGARPVRCTGPCL
jgi:hypothetical protein